LVLTINLQPAEEKSWMPAFAGMTVDLPRVTPNVSWYNRKFIVNNTILSRHTANGIMKQAGINHHF
jgi:hypothetical protein